MIVCAKTGRLLQFRCRDRTQLGLSCSHRCISCNFSPFHWWTRSGRTVDEHPLICKKRFFQVAVDVWKSVKFDEICTMVENVESCSTHSTLFVAEEPQRLETQTQLHKKRKVAEVASCFVHTEMLSVDRSGRADFLLPFDWQGLSVLQKLHLGHNRQEVEKVRQERTRYPMNSFVLETIDAIGGF